MQESLRHEAQQARERRQRGETVPFQKMFGKGSLETEKWRDLDRFFLVATGVNSPKAVQRAVEGGATAVVINAHATDTGVGAEVWAGDYWEGPVAHHWQHTVREVLDSVPPGVTPVINADRLASWRMHQRGVEKLLRDEYIDRESPIVWTGGNPSYLLSIRDISKYPIKIWWPVKNSRQLSYLEEVAEVDTVIVPISSLEPKVFLRARDWLRNGELAEQLTGKKIIVAGGGSRAMHLLQTNLDEVAGTLINYKDLGPEPKESRRPVEIPRWVLEMEREKVEEAVSSEVPPEDPVLFETPSNITQLFPGVETM